MVAIPKPQTFRSEAWRRAVAALPCCVCNAEPCQAAHRNEGKGTGLKTDDVFTFPLCPPCHAEYDQGKTLSREQKRSLADRWILETVRRLALDGVLKVTK